MPDPALSTLRVELDLPAETVAHLREASRANARSIAEEISAALRVAFSGDVAMDHIVESLDAMLESHPSPDRLDALPAEDGKAVREQLKRQLAARIGGADQHDE